MAWKQSLKGDQSSGMRIVKKSQYDELLGQTIRAALKQHENDVVVSVSA